MEEMHVRAQGAANSSGHRRLRAASRVPKRTPRAHTHAGATARSEVQGHWKFCGAS